MGLQEMLNSRKERLRCGGRFFSMITLILLIIGVRYLTSYSFPDEPIAVFYAFAAYISQIALFGFLPWIVLIIPLSLLLPKRQLITPVSVLLASALIAVLLLDTLLFAENRFHLSLLSISILGIKTWGFGLVYFFIALIFTSKLAAFSEKPLPKPLSVLTARILPPLFILLLLATHFIHAVADARYYSPVTRFTTQLPLFYPTTARRFMIKHGFADIDAARGSRNLEAMQSSSQGALAYPLNPLTYQSSEREYDFLLIIFDGLRADLLNEKNMPNLNKFSQKSMKYLNHYSGGNSTRMGVFSLFYGLPSTYWQDFVGVQEPAVMVEEFKTSGYKLGLFGSHTFDNPASLDRTAFSNIENLRMTTEGDFAPYQKDSIITDEWIDWLSAVDSSDDFFGFLFYDNPIAKSISDEEKSLLKGNRKAKDRAVYERAVWNSDSLAGVVLADLEKSGRLENTVVIITGDHGEEFDDNGLGFNGHGTAYSTYQTKVPLIVRIPGMEPAVIEKRTSHADLVATVMEEVLHCENPSSDYCSGNSIFSDKEWEWMITGSYYNYAILEPNQVTISYPGGYFEVRDNNYKVISNKNLHKKKLQDALAEMSRFYK